MQINYSYLNLTAIKNYITFFVAVGLSKACTADRGVLNSDTCVTEKIIKKLKHLNVKFLYIIGVGNEDT